MAPTDERRERLRRIEEIVHGALGVAPERRDEFIEEQCEDSDLRSEVESLLAFHGKSPDFLARPVLADRCSELLSAMTGASPERLVDTHIGPFRIVELIGVGGMGAVYRARRDDAQFEQTVAVKVILHDEHGEEVLDRFLRERQVLARLHHPNIARLLDGGSTDDGHPYFVMEYVEGRPITEFCDEQGLSERERILLFVEVCDAVAYAHRNLVIHRDLKPDNILVTRTREATIRSGVPMLLDFGIAEVVDPSTSQAIPSNRCGARRLTPAYASPEQVRGDPVTTCTDVYSLGVLLFELLVGSLPRQTAPSDSRDRLAPKLHRDIEAILEKALREQSELRYASASDLREDLVRYLERRPVAARPDTLGYRLTRAVSRHRMVSALALLVVLALCGGTIVSGVAFVRASHERDRALRAEAQATRRFDQVRGFARVLMFEVYDEIARLPGAMSARERVIESTLEYLEALAVEAGDDPDLLRELAEGYGRMGEVRGDWPTGNTGSTAVALASFEKTLEYWQRLHERDPEDREVLGWVISSHRSIGNMHLRMGHPRLALEHYEMQMRLVREWLASDPSNPDVRGKLLVALSSLGDVLERLGRVPEALAHHRESLAIASDLFSSRPDHDTDAHAVLVGLQRVASLLEALDRPDEAIRYREQQLEAAEAASASRPGDAPFRRSVAVAASSLAMAHHERGSPEEARRYLGRAESILRELVRADPRNHVLQRSRYIALAQHGVIDAADGAPEKAVNSFERALAIAEDVVREDPANAWARRDRAQIQISLARSLLSLDRSVEASDRFGRAARIAKKLVDRDQADMEAQGTWLEARLGQGDAAHAVGDRGGASAAWTDALDRCDVLVGIAPDEPRVHRAARDAASRLARLAKSSEAADADEAERSFLDRERQAVEALESLENAGD